MNPRTQTRSLINLLERVSLILSWLKRNVNSSFPSLGIFKPILAHLVLISKTRGVKGFIVYIKLLRLTLLNYLSGNPVRVPGIGMTTDGIPKIFGALIPIIRNVNHPHHFIVLRLLLTVLYVTRALKTKADPDFDPIVRPPKGIGNYSSFGNPSLFWQIFGYRPSRSVPRFLLWRKFHFTTKSGPNGHALNSWLTDWLSLPYQLRESIGILGGAKMISYMKGLDKGATWLSSFFPASSEGIPRRITYFAEKEGKTRVIAILDFFSQAVLKPLHLYIFKFFKENRSRLYLWSELF